MGRALKLLQIYFTGGMEHCERRLFDGPRSGVVYWGCRPQLAGDGRCEGRGGQGMTGGISVIPARGLGGEMTADADSRLQPGLHRRAVTATL